MGIFQMFFSGDDAANNKKNGLAPPKAPVRRSYEMWLGFEDGNDYQAEASFMLSADFVESKTNAGEIEVFYVYDPDCNDEYTPYELNDKRPYFFISPDINEVFCSVEEYCQSGKIENALWVQSAEYEHALFKAEFEYYGDHMMMYGYKRSDGSPGGMCLVYRDDTPQEVRERILGMLDTAIMTYTEKRL
ncbi:MAG: hypothetical protein HDT47_02260 [Ruminococcaceae bacterium]|nr:hypothetical protein [Oscillospiraceae bacterium]